MGPSFFADRGRWVHPLVREKFWRQVVVPTGPLIIFGCAISISFVYILRSLMVKKIRFFHYIAFTAFILYPAWLAQLEFSANIIPAAIGLLVICIACPILLCWDFSLNRDSMFRLFIVAILCAMGIGAYQSLIFLYLVIMFSATVFNNLLQDNYDLSRFFRKIGIILFSFLLAMIAYIVISKIVMLRYGLNPSEYGEKFVNLNALIDSPKLVFHTVLMEILQIYSLYWRDFGLAKYIYFTSMIISFIFCITSSNYNVKQKLSLGVSLLVIIFLPASFTFLSGSSMPLRSFMSAAASISCLLVLAYESSKSKNKKYLLTFIACLVSIQSLYILSVQEARTWSVQKHDLLLANALNMEILKVSPDAFRGVAKIDIVGNKRFNSIYPIAPSVTNGASFFEWDGGNRDRMVFYMNMIGFFNYIPAHASNRETVSKAMPSWPREGSVKLVGDVILIKLSD